MRVAFIGGSVTVGDSQTELGGTSWRPDVCKYLTAKYPQLAFEWVHAGIGGTDSTYGVFRFDEHVLAKGKVDLLFLEFAVNDAGNKRSSIRAMEGIVRKAKRHNPRIAIIMMYFATEGQLPEFRKGLTPANQRHHDAVAHHYGIPVVNLSRRVFELVDSGGAVFADLFRDTVHPNRTGNEWYARWIKSYLDVHFPSILDGTFAGDTGLPDPLLADNLEYAALLADEAIVPAGEGWVQRSDYSAEKVCNWTPPARVWESLTVGEELTVTFWGRSLLLGLLVGPDCGELEVLVDGGEWKRTALWDVYCEKFDRPKFVSLADELSLGEHRATLRISGASHPESSGHAIRILHAGVDARS